MKFKLYLSGNNFRLNLLEIKIYEENVCIIFPTNFDSLMSVVSLFEVKSSLYLHIWVNIKNMVSNTIFFHS